MGMNSFIGEYGCKLDTKGRLSVPSALCKQFDPSDLEQFVLNRGLNGCLNLYPLSEWARVTDKLRKLNRFNAKNLEFIRKFQNGATKVALDSSGRILLPKHLLEYAGISKEVVLSSAIDLIEIWDKAKYDNLMKSNNEDFAQLAEDVMGNLDGE
jgi:MraZ protein